MVQGIQGVSPRTITGYFIDYKPIVVAAYHRRWAWFIGLLWWHQLSNVYLPWNPHSNRAILLNFLRGVHRLG